MKFIIKDIKKEDDRDVLVVGVPPKKGCKTCNTKERREGSSYCEECANLYNRHHEKLS